jgi:hypothetical protein
MGFHEPAETGNIVDGSKYRMTNHALPDRVKLGGRE